MAKSFKETKKQINMLEQDSCLEETSESFTKTVCTIQNQEGHKNLQTILFSFKK